MNICIAIYRTWVGDILRKFFDALVKFKLSIRFLNGGIAKVKGRSRWGKMERPSREFQGERWIERQECSFCRRLLNSIIGF